MNFEIHSEYQPTGDQPQAIEKLSKGIAQGEKYQTLLGVTGSGKTFTIANVVQEVQKPTIVLAHNKTLAAQLFMEFKEFFPNNAVEYFVSYYDYYQPEAFIATTNTYIEKDLSINEEVEKLRLSATASLLSGRRDVLIVASVSCIYGIGNPTEFHKSVISLDTSVAITRTKLLQLLVGSLYSRSINEFARGTFRVKGDVIDVFPAYADNAIRIQFFGDEIEKIQSFDPISGNVTSEFDKINIYPANLFVTSPETMQKAIREIQDDMVKQVDFFRSIDKNLEAKRIEERTELDLEMIKELGYCSGIENYSRYMDRRHPGERPFCLLDYFPDDYLMVIDESHVTVPQVHAMYGGDRSRKEVLVEYGFRLPAALDNRPLRFEEFEAMQNQVIYVSATPADYELQKTQGEYVEQIIRPTGLLDPIIEVRPTLNQVDDLIEEIQKRVEEDERILVTTLTKKMAEELTKYFTKFGIRTRYIHSDVETLERIQIMQDLRTGLFDVLVGVNLLREGLDLPEVSLVAILDADKEGMLRSRRSLIQTIGRAARNLNGKAIMYADKITKSMQAAIDETSYRREKQMLYNKEHHKVPQALNKKISETLVKRNPDFPDAQYTHKEILQKVAEVQTHYSTTEIEDLIAQKQKEMEAAAQQLDFITAAKLRDEIAALKNTQP
ncbi:excinuclease ABC subunit UvrB [Elizabethkingia sp. JS20170427COW]|uniref:excinuclease ABC subunit UvrB n=1 Tax=Elizabethkingia sp. JS20170427COW TaxID=2583851 RepID=UPI0011101468|nr:excinuclease ABC subunit UvrB [Elizabethkingia sp. JS20170427COW]QCX53100.1 excinuclease ABC subunit UvrB [Elizabethkingia sp. JS20170427COW]